MVGAAGQGDKFNVFISYRRDDLAFADQLDAALGLAGFDTSIDRHGISAGEDWKKRLGALIREADTVVFVLSPSSADSPICLWEVEEAVRVSRRILPCSVVRSRTPARRRNLLRSTTSTSTRSRNHRTRDGARGSCGSRRRSIPIWTGCANIRTTYGRRTNGKPAAGLPTGLFPATTSQRPRTGPRPA